MLICLSIPCLPGGLPPGVPSFALAITVPEAIEFIAGNGLIAIAISGTFGLLVGWLAKKRSIEDSAAATPPPITPGFSEMRWRHEKLVLTERQQVEKQARLDAFAEGVGRFSTAEEQTVALKFFVLSERVREARQKVGSELSRMIAVRDRLDEIGVSVGAGALTERVCRGMAHSQAHRLEEVREALRGIAEEAVLMEDRYLSGPTDAADIKGLRGELIDLKGRILSLPQGWATSGDEADRRIRELLATVPHAQLAPVREVLLVDGSLTASLAGASGIDLPGAVGAVVVALDRATQVKSEVNGLPKLLSGLPSSLPGGNPFAEDGIDFGFPDPGEPDPDFRDPLDFVKPTPRPAKGFHDLTNGIGNAGAILVVEETKKIDEPGEVDRSLVLFCGNDVELWGKTIYRGARCRARSISEFPDWAKWVSIRRLDTGERVFAPVRTANLRSGQTADPFGFNGTNELFYGARHLGLFSESCPNEVETRFTYGGWGFGHRAHEIAPGVEQLQAAGWEGREIPSDTVFEIVIHEELPALGKLDRLLEGEVVGKR